MRTFLPETPDSSSKIEFRTSLVIKSVEIMDRDKDGLHKTFFPGHRSVNNYRKTSVIGTRLRRIIDKTNSNSLPKLCHLAMFCLFFTISLSNNLYHPNTKFSNYSAFLKNKKYYDINFKFKIISNLK